LLSSVLTMRLVRSALRPAFECRWLIDDAGILVSKEEGECLYSWSGITRVARSQGFITFQMIGIRRLYLPQRVLSGVSPEDFVRGVEVLRTGMRSVALALDHEVTHGTEAYLDVPAPPVGEGYEHSRVSFNFNRLRFITTSAALVKALRKGPLTGKSQRKSRFQLGLVTRGVVAGVVFGTGTFVALLTGFPVFAAVAIPLGLVVLFVLYTIVTIIRTPKRATLRYDFPWMNSSAGNRPCPLTVSFGMRGVSVEWTGGRVQTHWTAVSDVANFQGDLVVLGPTDIYAHIPGSAFLSPLDRQVFQEAALAFKRGETPVFDHAVWPPPPVR